MKRIIRSCRSMRWPARLGLATAVVLASAIGARAIITNLILVSALHSPMAEHLDQAELLALVQNNQTEEAFDEAFEHGDELFETVFNAIDGVGANVGNGQRFTRIPRADLSGPGQWAKHVPSRATGPNAQACNSCHDQPTDDGAGGAAANVHRDPQHRAILGKMIERNTPHMFGAGAVQRLAEEMTEKLQSTRDATIANVCAGPSGNSKDASLVAKGVRFGSITVKRVSSGGSACPNSSSRRFVISLDRVDGVSADLVVRPYQWKGSVAFLRDFNRDASHNELGMQPVETVGDGVDGDGDGVADEFTVGDMTALAVYLASQPRPVTKAELAALNLTPPLTPQEQTSIANGAAKFRFAGCDSCHKPALGLDDAMFSEPSQNANYRDAVFPGGQDPVARGVTPLFPVTVDLTLDLPDNRIDVGGGQIVNLGNHVSDGNGGAIVSLYGDLKRHYMGTGLAEPIDEVGTGAAVFLTENLWGVGSTAPYLHDGRATTLTEAILEHGGEAASARAAFQNLSEANQHDVIAFLDSLVLFKQE